MKKTKIKWRLSKLPTPSELVELVNSKLLTEEEAKEILFDTQTEEDVDKDTLKAEIKFLRQVVEDLSKSKAETVKVIEKHINHYKDWTWYQPYWTYCTSGTVIGISGDTTLTANGGTMYLSDTTTTNYTAAAASSITDLKTF